MLSKATTPQTRQFETYPWMHIICLKHYSQFLSTNVFSVVSWNDKYSTVAEPFDRSKLYVLCC